MNAEPRRRYSYFPGCSLMVTNRAYDVSSRSAARALGVELVELEDWNCCGATAYIAISEKESFVLSARNLALAEAAADKCGSELVLVCNGCHVALRKANRYMAENTELREEIRAALRAGGMDYRGTTQIRHLLGILVRDLGEGEIRRRVKRPLAGLRVAAYSGCQIGRPFSDVDDPEFPQLMDKLLGWLGAEVIEFPLAAKCCGGMMMTTQPEIGHRLTGGILHQAKLAGADCVATACPLCQMNLEAYQGASGAAVGADCSMPIFYFTQLMGVAFGLEEKELALRDNLTPCGAVLAEKI